MTVLVIGAGLVGSQIARILADRGERPVLLDRTPQPAALGRIVDLAKVALEQGDVLLPESLTEKIRKHAVDRIIHLAANPMLTIGAQRDPRAAVELNIMGTLNVLEAARELGLKRVIVASSNVLNHHIAGGAGKGDAMDEEAFPRPLSVYASCKQAIESLGLNYARWFGVDFVAVRYAAVCGPWSGAGGGGPSNVFRALVQDALDGKKAEVPAADLEWVYSKDAAAGTVQALDAKLADERVFNLTMGRLTTAEDLKAAVLAEIPGARLRTGQPANGSPALSAMKRAASLERSKRLLGYAPRYAMREAVRDMAEFLSAGTRFAN